MVKIFALFTLLLPIVVGCAGSGNPGPTDPADTIGDTKSPDVESPDAEAPDVEASDTHQPGPNDPFPLSYSTEQIEWVEEKTVTVGSDTYSAYFYRNKAYQCGKQGYFTFVVMHKQNQGGQKAPLWVRIHGGGVGYYSPDGAYHPGEDGPNVEESFNELLKHAPKANQDLVMNRRTAEGYRFLIPSMCDHDFHSGAGTPYPNNPNWDGNDTVDGMLALASAVEFTVNGGSGLEGYATSHVFVHGTSSGSSGAWSVSYLLSRAGIFLNGALLDAELLGARQDEIMGNGLTPPEMKDPGFSWQAVGDKVGVMMTNAEFFAETRVPEGFGVPLFDCVAKGDIFCGGQAALLSAAKNAGQETNCDYVHQLLRDAMDARPASEHHQWFRDESTDHVLTLRPGGVHDAVDSWLSAILADDPPTPW